MYQLHVTTDYSASIEVMQMAVIININEIASVVLI